MHSLSHCATAACDASPEVAFSLLADGSRLGSWSLGCWGAEPVGDGVLRGSSLFDGSTSYVRADPDPARLGVDYAVGSGPDELVHRISARVVPGAGLGMGAGRCLVTLLAWRAADVSEERWRQLAAAHEAEILLLRARIEEAA